MSGSILLSVARITPRRRVLDPDHGRSLNGPHIARIIEAVEGAFAGGEHFVPSASVFEIADDGDVHAAVERVADQLARAGARVEQREPGVSIDEIRQVWSEYFPLLSTCLMEISSTAMAIKAPEGPPVTFANWARVLAGRDRLITSIDGFLTEFDAFLCPAVISPAFPHSEPRTPISVDDQLVES